VKLSQAGHTALYCIGGVALQASWLSYLGPVTATNCMARPWLLGISYSVMLGALIRKIFIVMKLLETTKTMSKGSSKRNNHLYSVLSVVFCAAIDAAIIIPWQVLSPSVPTEKGFLVPSIGTVKIDDYYCYSPLTENFTLILAAYKICQTIVGAIFAYKVKNIDSIVGDSTMMLYSTYNLIVSGLLLLLISFVAVLPGSIWIIVASAISCLAVSVSLALIFVPKIYIQYYNVEIIASQLFMSANAKVYALRSPYPHESLSLSGRLISSGPRATGSSAPYAGQGEAESRMKDCSVSGLYGFDKD
jgi:hypothetical protein